VIDPKTYEKALRAARNVARSSGRAAVGLGLLANTTGCLSSGSPGVSVEADAAADAALSDAASEVISDVVDAVMADLAMDSTGLAETTEGDAVKVDAVITDATEPDATEPDAVIADATEPDATEPDAAIADAVNEDVLAEVIEGDGTSTVIADPCVCLTPTDLACTGWETTDAECKVDEDCAEMTWEGSDTQCGDEGFCQIGTCGTEEEPFSQFICYEGMCSEGEGFGECCEAAYNNEDCANKGAIPGCTPWGPPAPGAYDGLTLADYGLA